MSVARLANAGSKPVRLPTPRRFSDLPYLSEAFPEPFGCGENVVICFELPMGNAELPVGRHGQRLCRRQATFLKL